MELRSPADGCPRRRAPRHLTITGIHTRIDTPMEGPRDHA
jgi:hypothetical protein